MRPSLSLGVRRLVQRHALVPIARGPRGLFLSAVAFVAVGPIAGYLSLLVWVYAVGGASDETVRWSVELPNLLALVPMAYLLGGASAFVCGLLYAIAFVVFPRALLGVPRRALVGDRARGISTGIRPASIAQESC
jgi:hypothetical protein